MSDARWYAIWPDPRSRSRSWARIFDIYPSFRVTWLRTWQKRQLWRVDREFPMGLIYQFWHLQSYLWNGLSENRQILCAGEIYQVLALEWQTTPLTGMVKVTWPFKQIFAPVMSLELVKLGTSNFVCWLMHRSTSACIIYYFQKGYV